MYLLLSTDYTALPQSTASDLRQQSHRCPSNSNGPNPASQLQITDPHTQSSNDTYVHCRFLLVYSIANYMHHSRFGVCVCVCTSYNNPFKPPNIVVFGFRLKQAHSPQAQPASTTHRAHIHIHNWLQSESYALLSFGIGYCVWFARDGALVVGCTQFT